MPDLPEWATELTPPAYADDRPVHQRVAVDAGQMYPAILSEYAAFYADPSNIPDDWKKADGELRKEWADCLDSLDPESPSAYWAEVAHQTMKLDIQMACGGFRVMISVDADEEAKERYAQANLEAGRGPEKAAGGSPVQREGKEARAHYKRLRGYLLT